MPSCIRLLAIGILIGLICMNEPLYCQNPKIDSLTQALSIANDTNRVHTLRRLGYAYRSVGKEQSLEAIDKSITLAKEIGFDIGEGMGLYAKALTYGMTGEYDEAIYYLNQCLAKSLEIKDIERVSYVYSAFGIVYKRLGNYPKSKSFYLKDLHLIDSLNLEGKSSTYINLGILYDLLNEPDLALENYEKARNFNKNPYDEATEINILSNIAVLHFNNKRYEKSIEQFITCAEYQKENNLKIQLCGSYSNVGNNYIYLKNWRLAEKYLIEARELANELSLKRELVNINHNLTKLMKEQGHINEAKKYMYLNLTGAKSLGSFAQLKESHKLAMEVHAALGDMDSVLYHTDMHILFRDSLLNETKIKEIKSLEVEHDVYRKDKELIAQELELELLNAKVALENKRKIYLFMIALLLLFSVVLVYRRYQNKKKSNAILQEKNELISAQKKEIEVINTELEKRMLRAQMNPHFIFNSLNSIQHFITTNNKTAALTYLTQFSKLLREVLESSINNQVILEDEINLIKIYLSLEALRFDQSFTYHISVEEGLDTYQNEVPILLVQPYIENAIIHGLMPKIGEKKLDIAFSDLGEFIQCTIQDNGIGRAASSQTSSETKRPSRGMSVTAQRLRSLQSNDDQELIIIEDLTANSQPSGTKVTIRIPKN